MIKIIIEDIDILIAMLGVAIRLLDNIPICPDFNKDKEVCLLALKKIAIRLGHDADILETLLKEK